MAKVSIIPLRTFATDSATSIKGYLAHLIIRGDGSQVYGFQPNGLNPTNGQPRAVLWLTADRVTKHAPRIMEEIPMEVIGSVVEDIASGFKGVAVDIVMHTTGCIHINVQPSDKIKDSGEPVEAKELDIRRLKGTKIPVLSEKEIAADIKKKPSPSAASRPKYR